MTPRMFYFGCWGVSGHYLFTDRGEHPEPHVEASLRAAVGSIDGRYPPQYNQRAFSEPGYQEEGLALVHHVNGWTVLAFWDRSIDRRFACNSNFIAEGAHDFDAMRTLARDRFPTIWARFPFEVRPFHAAESSRAELIAMIAALTTERDALKAELAAVRGATP